MIMEKKQILLDWLEDVVQDAELNPLDYSDYARGIIHAFEEHGTITEEEMKEYLSRIEVDYDA